MKRVLYRRLVSESGSDHSTVPQDNNLLRLKRISQSFEDLTSECLYSKWKKARKNGAKIDGDYRSISWNSLISEEIVINRDTKYKFKNSSSTLRGSRPRGWTICNGNLSRDALQMALVCISPGNKNCQVDDAGSASSVNDVETTSMTIVKSSEKDDDEEFSVASSDFELKEPIESKSPKITIISGITPKTTCSLSESDQRINEQDPFECRQTNNLLIFVEARASRQSCRESEEIEFLRNEEMAQRHGEATSGGSSSQEDIWQKRNSTGDLMAEGRHKRMPSLIHARARVNSSPCSIQEASFGSANDRSQQESKERYNSGPTCALINQPQLINSTHEAFPKEVYAKDINANCFIHKPTMSDSKESRYVEDKEKDDRTVRFYEYSEHNQMSEGSHGVRRSQTLPRMPKRPLASLTSKNWKESEIKTRKAAEDLIQNINNSDEKSAQERVDVVEAAFEWIRKEVADLRAQDKDIMRMFTKIQAGIRTIKFDQSALMESEDEFISTPDLSSSPQTTSSYGGSIQRRASLR